VSWGSATETARDIIQHFIDSNTALQPHALEHHFVPTVAAPRQALPYDCPWQMSSVFVYDFILAAVESSDGSMHAKTTRAALQEIHSFFPPLDVSGDTGGKDPVSIKKLERGDARWS
jgi:hypothetical protein